MKTAKKIIALAIGATMVGSTIVGAMAADLKSWPAPFVTKDTSGKPVFDAIMVVGDTAAPADIIGITDIAMSLQYQMVEEKAVSGAASVSLSGDSKKIETSSNKLELNETLNSITTSVTSSDLKLLMGSEFSNEYGTSTLTQTIDIPTYARVVFEADPDDETNTIKHYLKLDSGKQVYTYTLAASPSIKSDHNSGGYLEDIRNKKITLLGSTYTVLTADHDAQNQTTLTLMGGAVTDVLDEGETKTYTVAGKEYEVTAAYIGASEVKIKVNGELTDALAETKTYKLKDSTEVGIIDIMAQNLAGEVDRVEFSLGANKMQLEDLNTVSNDFAGTVTIGSEDLSNVKVDIVTSLDQGTTAGNDVKVSSIKFNYNVSQNLYLGVGDKASTKADEAESQTGSFLLSAFDYKFEGPQTGATEEIKLYPSGSNNYKLEFTSKAGIKYAEEVFGYDATVYGLGRYSGTTWYTLVTAETEEVADEETFCVNKNKYSRILQYKDVIPGSSTSDNEGTLRFKDAGSGDMFDVSYSGSGLTGDLIVDGNTFKVVASADANGATVNVDMDGDGDVTGALATCDLYTQYEAKITVTNVSATNSPSVTILSEDDEDSQTDTVVVNATINGDGKIDLENKVKITSTSANYKPGDGVAWSMTASKDESNVYVAYTNYGMALTMDQKESSSTTTQNDFKVVYPDEQINYAFFVVGSDTMASSVSGGSTTQVVHKINVGATKLASQVADVTAQNLVVVGGPCVNAVAAELMGNPSPCAKDFSAGKAMIKMFEATTGKVAMLVAGYEAVDTTRATKVVAQDSGAKLKAVMAGKKEVSVNTINEEPVVEVATA
ncbi:MAG: hypothetical protein WC471_04610 [Candidatus Woesearchaeota archaeon]